MSWGRQTLVWTIALPGGRLFCFDRIAGKPTLRPPTSSSRTMGGAMRACECRVQPSRQADINRTCSARTRIRTNLDNVDCGCSSLARTRCEGRRLPAADLLAATRVHARKRNGFLKYRSARSRQVGTAIATSTGDAAEEHARRVMTMCLARTTTTTAAASRRRREQRETLACARPALLDFNVSQLDLYVRSEPQTEGVSRSRRSSMRYAHVR